MRTRKMQKLQVCGSVLALVLTAGFAQATERVWDGGGSGDLWTTADNWNPNGVPSALDLVFINDTSAGEPLIQTGIDATTPRVNMATLSGSADVVLNMTGGSLTNLGEAAEKYPMTVGSKPVGGVGTFNLSGGAVVSPGFLISNSGGSEGVVNMTGGSIDARKSGTLMGQFWENFGVGDAGTGTLNMSDGSIQANNLMVPGRPGPGVGLLNMTGGTIEADNVVKVRTNSFIQLDGGTITGDDLELDDTGEPDIVPLVDITGAGMLILRDPADEFLLEDYIEFGLITGNGVVGEVNLFENPSTGFYELTAISVADAADFDEDGDVDGIDFLAWQRGTPLPGFATKSEGDANGDKFVNEIDLGIWQDEFGNGAAAMAALASVPEPATLLLFAMGSLAIFAGSRRGQGNRH